MIRIACLIVVAGLAGCAATGANYTDDRAARGAVRTDTSRVTVFRGDHSQYSGRSARITVNGSVLGHVDHKGFNVFDIAPGLNKVSVDVWDMPGRCDLTIEVKPASAYYFEVKPRQASLMSGAMFGVFGMAIESSGKECGGGFSISPVQQDAAEPALKSLRLSQ